MKANELTSLLSQYDSDCEVMISVNDILIEIESITSEFFEPLSMFDNPEETILIIAKNGND